MESMESFNDADMDMDIVQVLVYSKDLLYPYDIEP